MRYVCNHTIFDDKVKNVQCTHNLLWIQSGSRLFGFIGAGATLGQLFGSLFATGMAWLGPRMFACSVFSILNFCSVFLSILRMAFN